jgi:hypothetical protein
MEAEPVEKSSRIASFACLRIEQGKLIATEVLWAQAGVGARCRCVVVVPVLWEEQGAGRGHGFGRQALTAETDPAFVPVADRAWKIAIRRRCAIEFRRPAAPSRDAACAAG